MDNPFVKDNFLRGKNAELFDNFYNLSNQIDEILDMLLDNQEKRIRILASIVIDIDPETLEYMQKYTEYIFTSRELEAEYARRSMGGF